MKKELKANNAKYKFSKNNGITLISLVITIVVLIILASVAIYLSLSNNGIFNRANQAKESTNKQTATEIINLKITTAQMNKYAEKQQMPTLQELADILYEDNEIEYIALETKVGAKEKITVGEKTSIFTKLNEYPYEFEINSSLQLASINGIKIANNNEYKSDIWKKYMMNEEGYIIGQEVIELPTKYEEIYIKVSFSSECIYHYNIPYELLTETEEGWREGYNNGSYNYCSLGITKTKLYLKDGMYGGAKEVLDTAKIEVYYK